MDLRSRQVHPKAQRREVVRQESPGAAFKAKDDLLSALLKVSYDYHPWNFETARRGLEIVDAFLALFLLTVCGLTHEEIAYSIMPGVGPADGAWKATIMMQDHFPVWRRGKRRCGLKLTFLGKNAVEPKFRRKIPGP